MRNLYRDTNDSNFTYLLFLGWLAFDVSMFLPAVYYGFTVSGYELFVVSIKNLIGLYKEHALLLSMGGVANLVFLATPVVYVMNRRGRWRYGWVAVLAASVVAGSYLFMDFRLLVGYYVWVGAFILVGVGLVGRDLKER